LISAGYISITGIFCFKHSTNPKLTKALLYKKVNGESKRLVEITTTTYGIGSKEFPFGRKISASAIILKDKC